MADGRKPARLTGSRRKAPASVGASTRFATIPLTLLLRRSSRGWPFDDPYGSRARTVFISDSSAGRIESADLPLGASSDSASVWLPDFATRNATLP